MQNLTTERYEVIANYPFSCLPIGFIITEPIALIKTQALNNLVSDFSVIRECPEIFKKLNWNEKVKSEDMPKYLKHLNGSVREVSEFINNNNTVIFIGGRVRNLEKHWMPATQQEYEAYLQTKKQK